METDKVEVLFVVLQKPLLLHIFNLDLFLDWGSYEEVGSQCPDRFHLLRRLRLYFQLPSGDQNHAANFSANYLLFGYR